MLITLTEIRPSRRNRFTFIARRIPSVFAGEKALAISKWHTRSGIPSPFTSSAEQKAKLRSSPVGPNVIEVWSIRCTGSKPGAERVATGILAVLFGLIV